MAEIVKMPKLSDTMTDGVIAKWHKKVGDKVKSGEILAEIETDKATMEFESFVDGTLLYIGVQEKESAPVDAVLAIFGEKGEDISKLISTQSSKTEETIQSKNVDSTPKISTKDLSHIKAKVIRMPKLSDTMTEGVVAKWHKKVGDKVTSGEILADIETDKATMEFESFEDGYLLHIGIEQGGKAAVDSVLAVIGEKNADFKALLDAVPQQTIVYKQEKTIVSDAQPEVKVVKAEESKPIQLSENRIKASPLARKMAAERNINLSLVKGTGDGGRVTKFDIENFNGSVSSSSFVGVEKYTEVPLSQMRKTIARRLGESKFNAPHFYLTVEIDMENAINTRNSINSIEGVKISFNDLIIKAASMALKKHPNVNSSWLTDKIRYNEHVNIGVAVAVDEGLLVPVIRFADGKTLSQISQEVRIFAEKAKDKKLQPQDWEGSTFTISNLGMFGIEEFTAIINPPDACIMAVGGIKQTPVVKNNMVVPGNTMKVTLSCDHRVVDGATGASFLKTFKNYMENPVIFLGAQNI